MTVALPVLAGAAGAAFGPPGARIGPRLLDSYELLLVVSGAAELRIDGAPGDQHGRHRLEPGAIALLQPGMRDSWQWSAATGSRHLYVHFHLQPAPPDVAGWPLVRAWPPMAATSAAFRQLLWLTRSSGEPDRASDPSSSLAARWWLGALLATVVEGAADSAPRDGGPSGRAVLRAVAHVRRRWEAEGLVAISRTELAAAAGLSVGRLAQAWREEFGGGPAACLEQARLRQALPLLERSALGLAQVAEVTGFADASHFSHRFRQHFGHSPAQWRAHPQPLPPLAAGRARLEALLSAPV